MKTIEIEVNYDDLMTVIEDFLVYQGYLKPTEGLMFADLGLPITEDNKVQIYAEVDALDDQGEPADYYELVANGE